MEQQYRPMRRKDRAMTPGETMKLLERGESGVLSTVGPDGQPYGVPVSYVVLDGAIYFHCARTGQKLDNAAHEPRVSFCVVGDAEAFYDNNFSTTYESAIVFGALRTVEDRAEKERALLALCNRYLPDYMEHAEEYIAKAFAATAVCAVSMDSVTGKALRRQ